MSSVRLQFKTIPMPSLLFLAEDTSKDGQSYFHDLGASNSIAAEPLVRGYLKMRISQGTKFTATILVAIFGAMVVAVIVGQPYGPAAFIVVLCAGGLASLRYQ